MSVGRSERGLALTGPQAQIAVCAYCAEPMSDVRNGGVTVTLWPEGSALVLPGNQKSETALPFCSAPCALHGLCESAITFKEANE